MPRSDDHPTAHPNDRKTECGPFDIIGDVHGCFDELVELLVALGYEVDARESDPQVTSPAERRVIFLGDLADRGPKCPAVLRLVMNMVREGSALCVMGNHDNKLMRKLRGNKVDVSWGMVETLAQLEPESEEFKLELLGFLQDLVPHYVLDSGALVVAHAGLREELQGEESNKARAFCLYGEPTGELDELGYPVRKDWAADYSGSAAVVYGHTPVEDALWINNTINIDTGCVYGGQLSALRYPERELVQVRAREAYYSRTAERAAATRAKDTESE